MGRSSFNINISDMSKTLQFPVKYWLFKPFQWILTAENLTHVLRNHLHTSIRRQNSSLLKNYINLFAGYGQFSMNFESSCVPQTVERSFSALICFVPDFQGRFEPPGRDESLNMETVKIWQGTDEMSHVAVTFITILLSGLSSHNVICCSNEPYGGFKL